DLHGRMVDAAARRHFGAWLCWREPDPGGFVATMQLPAVPMDVIANNAGHVDTDAAFPDDALDALRERRLFGLLVPTECGGLGASLTDAAQVVEQVSAA